jgi:hypothetical protein
MTADPTRAAERIRLELCKLILWHDVHDQNPGPIGVAHADREVASYMSAGWSWYSPQEIVTWHPWFV